MIGGFLSGLVLLFIGEGIFQIGLILPWIWWLVEAWPQKSGGEKERFMIIQVVTFLLGVVAAVVTGTILGGISLFWLVCLWLFRYINQTFSELSVVLVIILMLIVNVIGDLVIGTRWGVWESLILALETLFVLKIVRNQSEIKLRRVND